jgi:hypothetical protein
MNHIIYAFSKTLSSQQGLSKSGQMLVLGIALSALKEEGTHLFVPHASVTADRYLGDR